jgi:tetratricopeptide (TPR) repeat protein
MAEPRKRRQRKPKAPQRRKARAVNRPARMASIFGAKRALPWARAVRNARFEAQQLAYAAMQAPTERKQIALAQSALALNPRCIDALLIVAAMSRDSAPDHLQKLRLIVKVGEEDLGKRFFRENKGMFWGILETRPYMRAREALAELLVRCGKMDEAIEHLEAMLELNPNDNQGVRYLLLGHYLSLDRLDDAAALLKRYKKDGSAMFAWGAVLQRFLAGDEAGARAAAIKARAVNKYAQAYLSGEKRLPRKLPDAYGFGDANEGIVCALEIGEAWKRHPRACDWLKAMD